MKLVGGLLVAAAAVAILGLAADLAASNPELVTVKLWSLGSDLRMPVWLLALGSFACGLVMGGTAMLASLARSAWQKRQLRARIRRLEQAAASRAGGDGARPPGP